MNTNDLETLLPDLMAIEKAKVMRPQMPVHVNVQEAENLGTWMRDDIPLILGVGVKPALIETFEARIGALREAESRWKSARNSRESAQVTYDVQSGLAFDLLADSLRHMRFAFRKRPTLLSRLPRVGERMSRSRKFQTMNDLAVIGRENSEILESCGFDLTRLETLAILSDEMAELYSASVEERLKGKKALDIRNRAFIHLKEAVDEVREAARFLFSKDPDRLEGYVSEHSRRSRASGRKNEEATGVAEARQDAEPDNVIDTPGEEITDAA